MEKEKAAILRFLKTMHKSAFEAFTHAEMAGYLAGARCIEGAMPEVGHLPNAKLIVLCREVVDEHFGAA